MSKPLYESFSWFRDDVKTTSQVGSKLRIKGKALYPTISGNQRKYVEEELIRAARTLAGKPLTINHDMSRIIGHVLDADFEEGYIEYVAEVNRPEYVEKFRDRFTLSSEKYVGKWGRDPIYGVSVEANYRFHEEQCDERGCLLEPHGIIFNALSVVEDPEKPGVQGTTYELMEQSLAEARIVSFVLQDRAPHLYESYHVNVVNKLEEEEKNMAEKQTKNTPLYTIADDAVMAFDPRATMIFEQEEPTEPEPCPEGQTRDPDSGKCVPVAAEQLECGEGFHEEDGNCVPDAAEQLECGEGFHEEDGNCVPDVEPAVVEPDLHTAGAAPAVESFLHRLGEPFADYMSFDDCVAKNQGKAEDPEAYCADIKRKVEGETVERRQTLEQMMRRVVKEELAKLGSGSIDQKHADEQKALKEKQAQEKRDAQVKQMQEQVKKLGFNIASIQKQVNSTSTSTRQNMVQIKQLYEKQCGSLKTLADKLQGFGGTVKNLVDFSSSVNETLTTLPTQFTSSLEGVNTRLTHMEQTYTASVKAHDQHIHNLNAEYQKYKQGQEETIKNLHNKLKETEHTPVLKKLEDDIANLKTHLKPQFKGKIDLPVTADDTILTDSENPYV